MRRALLVDGAFAQADGMVAALRRGGYSEVVRCPTVAAATAASRGGETALFITPMSAIEGAAARDFEALLDTHPNLVSIATAPSTSAETVLVALRAGCTEFLEHGISPLELAAALVRLERRRGGQSAPGEVTAVFCSKGGQGATTLAVNLAHALVRRHARRVAVLDLVVGLGDVALQLDMRPEYGVGDLAQKDAHIDRDLVESVAAFGPDGLAVFAAPEQLELSSYLTGDVVTTILSHCRQVYEHTIVDCEHAFGPRTIATLDAADRILLLAQLQVASLTLARRALGIFSELGYADDKVQVVINREGASDVVTADEAARVLGRPIHTRLPNDFVAASEAQAHGAPLLRHVPTSSLARAYETFAARVAGAPDVVETTQVARKRGLLRLLGRSA